MFITESLHTIGIALLFFVVLPELDVVKGAMITNCLCIIPAILGLLSRNKRDSKRFVKVIVDMAAIVAQVTGFIVWPLLENKPVLWLIPVSALCISLGWWENYVTRQSPIGKLNSDDSPRHQDWIVFGTSLIPSQRDTITSIDDKSFATKSLTSWLSVPGIIKSLGRLKDELNFSRYYLYRFMSVWKVLLLFMCLTFILWTQGDEPAMFFQLFNAGFGPHNIVVEEVCKKF